MTDLWRVASASVTGTAHRRLDGLCQDACGWRVRGDGVLVAVAADGAGAAPRSREGAQVAVAAALLALDAPLGPPDAPGLDEIVRAAFARAREALSALAAQGDLPLAHFACTLACALVTADAALTGSLGDSAIVVEMADGLRLASALPQRGEYANETNFLTQDGALERVQLTRSDGSARALAVFTDGLLRLALQLPAYSPHEPFFRPLFTFMAQAGDPAQAAAELTDFLDSERVNARTDDDKTLVLAVRAPAGTA